jgi:hypothetical protein
MGKWIVNNRSSISTKGGGDEEMRRAYITERNTGLESVEIRRQAEEDRRSIFGGMDMGKRETGGATRKRDVVREHGTGVKMVVESIWVR